MVDPLILVNITLPSAINAEAATKMRWLQPSELVAAIRMDEYF